MSVWLSTLVYDRYYLTKKSIALKKSWVKCFEIMSTKCFFRFLLQTVLFHYLCTFSLRQSCHYRPFEDYLLFPEFLKINRTVQIHVSENNINVNIVRDTNENDQFISEYPNELLQEDEIEESSLLVF